MANIDEVSAVTAGDQDSIAAANIDQFIQVISRFSTIKDNQGTAVRKNTSSSGLGCGSRIFIESESNLLKCEISLRLIIETVE